MVMAVGRKSNLKVLDSNLSFVKIDILQLYENYKKNSILIGGLNSNDIFSLAD